VLGPISNLEKITTWGIVNYAYIILNSNNLFDSPFLNHQKSNRMALWKNRNKRVEAFKKDAQKYLCRNKVRIMWATIFKRLILPSRIFQFCKPVHLDLSNVSGICMVIGTGTPSWFKMIICFNLWQINCHCNVLLFCLTGTLGQSPYMKIGKIILDGRYYCPSDPLISLRFSVTVHSNWTRATMLIKLSALV